MKYALPLTAHLGATLALAVYAGAQPTDERARALFDQAVSEFHKGRISRSVEAFDALARLVPSEAPRLWQRGIALYYARRYKDCRAQFESHRTVNPDDVENAAWHFLCVARAESIASARKALLPVGSDPRLPMSQIYQMYRGALRPGEVLAAATAEPASEFYAHLYVGLYLDALGDPAGSFEQLRIAAEDRYADVGGYMHSVARIHIDALRRRR